MRSRSIALVSVVLISLALASCSSSASTPAAGASSAKAPTVSDAWVRPSTGTGDPVAAYLVITNETGRDDALLGASSPAASSVEIHRTSTDMNGMTGMKPVARVDVPAGSTVKLAPGETHLMLMGLSQPLQAGGKIELDLLFERAGKVVVQAEVRPA
jgi:copper(I)-binding protein